MEKLNVTVGFVFTQVMFCDNHGKLHLHRVLTNVDKPWETVKEVLGLVKEALGMDQPKVVHGFTPAVLVQLEYKKANFQSYLAQLRDELAAAFSACMIVIEGLYEDVQPAMEQQEAEEVVALEHQSMEWVEEMEECMLEEKPSLFVIHTSNSMELDHYVQFKDAIGHFEFVQQSNPSFIREYNQRGSPLLTC